MLGHQTALEAVGQTRDHARQIGQLHIQIGPQPGQFLGVAELIGIDRLIESGAKDLIGRLARAIILHIRPSRLGAVTHFG